jgi:hypothetical protein
VLNASVLALALLEGISEVKFSSSVPRAVNNGCGHGSSGLTVGLNSFVTPGKRGISASLDAVSILWLVLLAIGTNFGTTGFCGGATTLGEFFSSASSTLALL